MTGNCPKSPVDLYDVTSTVAGTDTSYTDIAAKSGSRAVTSKRFELRHANQYPRHSFWSVSPLQAPRYANPGATHFDGVADYYKRDGAPTGISTAVNKVLFSFWMNPVAGAGVTQRFPFAFYSNQYSVVPNHQSPTLYFDVVAINNSGWALAVSFAKQDGTSGSGQSFSRVVGGMSALAPFGGWQHVIGSLDASDGSGQLTVNGVPGAYVASPSSDIPFTVDWTTIAGVSVGSWYNFQTEAPIAGTRWLECLAEVWVSNVASIPDLSVDANVQKFRTTSGKPADLGAQGELPTGVQPPWYFPKADGVNLGYGGNLNTVGAPAACGTHP